MKLTKTTTPPTTLIEKIVIAVIVGCIVFALPKACTRDNDARRILTEQGFTEIVITGWRPMMAGRDESTSTGFIAKSPNGTIVTGAVTSGLFKGSTIRFD